MSQKSYISLVSLSSQINDALSVSDLSSRWVVAEIAAININRTSGHCYLELVEKSPVSGQTLASVRATIWAAKFRLISSYFKIETGEEMSVGMKIMFCCSVSFHAIYSISINITDIDPTYTIGEAQKQRNLIIETLKSDGVFDMNKELEIESVVQRIAVVSSANAAGFEDFLHQLDSTVYRFDVKLFPAMMQGKETESSVCEALSRIANSATDFDVVVIIRGGGATTDLQWFDSYLIASYIAQMPLPVLTGIGHQKDLSIADMVANMSLKTPTAVASFIIEKADDFYQYLTSGCDFIFKEISKLIDGKLLYVNNMSLKISDIAKESLNRQSISLTSKQSALESSITRIIGVAQSKLGLYGERLGNYTSNALGTQFKRVEHLKQMIVAQDPINVLKRGYAIVKIGDSIVSNPSQIKIDDSISIKIKDKTINSKVISIE